MTKRKELDPFEGCIQDRLIGQTIGYFHRKIMRGEVCLHCPIADCERQFRITSMDEDTGSVNIDGTGGGCLKEETQAASDSKLSKSIQGGTSI